MVKAAREWLSAATLPLRKHPPPLPPPQRLSCLAGEAGASVVVEVVSPTIGVHVVGRVWKPRQVREREPLAVRDWQPFPVDKILQRRPVAGSFRPTRR